MKLLQCLMLIVVIATAGVSATSNQQKLGAELGIEDKEADELMDKRDEVDDEYDEVIGLSQIQLNDDVDKRSRARRRNYGKPMSRCRRPLPR